eukprot:Hpha_TRINITY_DN16949_c0_g1::TRINITY_DN16949_c0_g1_i1::g.55301::m.55301
MLRCEILLLCAAGAAASETVVGLPDGKVEGAVTPDGKAVAFRGIPYAAPPLGALRWQEAEPAMPWEGTREALSNPASCPQTCDMPTFACTNHTSEDCLYANVFTPRGAPTTPGKLPVVLFLYGGNFYEGGIEGQLYDGRILANSTGTVVVVINYRLGILGFMAGNGFGGNYGLSDQLQALKWIQRSISAFGGDPGRVTVWGQSAGSMSIAIWLTQPEVVKGLFHGAILESEPFGFPYRDEADWSSFQGAIASKLDCSKTDRACLQGKSWQEVMKAEDKVQHDIFKDLKKPLALFVPYTPLVGSKWVPAQPIQHWQDTAKELLDVPLIIGNTKEEATLFIYEGFAKDVPSIEYEALVPVIYGAFNGKGHKVLEKYPCHWKLDCRSGWGNLTTVSLFHCPNRAATRGVVARNRTNPVWRYVFDHPAADAQAQPIAACRSVSCHAADVPFFWSSPAVFNNTFYWTPEEQTMSARLTSMLGSFFKTGVPATPDVWPQFTEAGGEPQLVVSTPEFGIVRNFLQEECNFWDQIGYPAA